MREVSPRLCLSPPVASRWDLAERYLRISGGRPRASLSSRGDRKSGREVRSARRVLINTRARILAAARATIIESGYHAASLEQVAIAAGVTRVTVYRQYGNKRGLLEALADDLAERSDVVALADAADRHSDALMALTELVAALARLWSVDPALMRRLVGLSAVDPEVAVVIASREDWRRQRVRALTARLVNQRVVRLPFNPSTAAACIDAATSFATFDTLTEQIGLERDRLVDVVINLLSSVINLSRE
jgi:AcrR family transcriptional regulator